MAGVFKSLDKSDVRLTPFRAYKQWNDAITYCNYSESLETLTIPTLISFNQSGSELVIANSTQYAVLNPNSGNLNNLSGTKTTNITPIRALSKYATGSNTVVALTNTAIQTINTTTFVSASVYSMPGLQKPIDIAKDATNNRYVIVSETGINSGRISVLNSTYTLVWDDTESLSFIKVSTEAYDESDSSYYWVLAYDNTGLASQGAYILSYSTAGGAPNSTTQITNEFGIQIQGFVYAKHQNGHYSLVKNKLYFTPLTLTATILVATGVASVLSDTNGHIHAILQGGNLLVDVVSDGIGVQYTTVVGSPYVGTNTVTQAVINSDNQIGILANNVFYIYDIPSSEFKNPRHIEASTGITRIYADKELSTKILGIGPNILVDLSCESDHFTLYKADYSTSQQYKKSDPTDVNFDQGNEVLTGGELLTADSKYQRVVHKSINHLFYRYYQDNNKGAFGSGNINFQKRSLNDKAFILSLPQKKYGEEIQQGSVVVNIKRNGNFYNGTYTLVDDLYGNLYVSNSISGTPVSSSNVVGKFHFDFGYKYYQKGPITIEDDYTEGYWPMKAYYNNVIFDNIKAPKEDLGACLYFTGSNSSGLVIAPGPVPKFNQSYNFENSDFSIFFTIKPQYPSVNYEFANIIAKEGPVEDIFIDINGNIGASPAGTNYPYKVKLGVSGSNQGKLFFGRSSGFQTSEINTGLTTLSAGVKYNIAVVKQGSNMKIYVDGSMRANGTDTTTTGTYQSKQCSNQSNIYVGIQHDSGSAYNGYLDNLKLYNKALTVPEINYIQNTQGVGDVYVGNVFYKHGMIVITDQLVSESDVLSASCRGTQTIYETEVSCTIGGGEFNHSSNPTLQEYDPISDEFIFRPFVSSSDFKPYITTVGLYDDFGNLLVIGKLGQPIKTPNNTDTTFIVRFDR